MSSLLVIIFSFVSVICCSLPIRSREARNLPVQGTLTQFNFYFKDSTDLNTVLDTWSFAEPQSHPTSEYGAEVNGNGCVVSFSGKQLNVFLPANLDYCCAACAAIPCIPQVCAKLSTKPVKISAWNPSPAYAREYSNSTHTCAIGISISSFCVYQNWQSMLTDPHIGDFVPLP
jgi:hypothetical protein